MGNRRTPLRRDPGPPKHCITHVCLTEATRGTLFPPLQKKHCFAFWGVAAGVQAPLKGGTATLATAFLPGAPPRDLWLVSNIWGRSPAPSA